MNLMDKAIAYVSPQAGIKRAFARKTVESLNSGYSHYGASDSKKSVVSWDSESLSSDEDINENIESLRERSRDLYYGAPIATSAIKTVRTNVVGSGLKCKPKINYKYLGMSEEQAREWEDKTEFEFKLWAESVHCDAQRQNNLYELQQLAFMSWLMNGETLAVLPMIKRIQLPYDLRVMLIESDRLVTPPGMLKDNVSAGIETGSYGEIIAYHIANKHPKGKNSFDVKYKRIEKYGKKSGRINILHLMESERIGQTRGIPFLAPIIIPLKQLARYTEAEIDAAVVSSFFTVFIENKTVQESGAFGQSDGVYTNDDDDTEEDDEPVNLKLGPASVIELEEGQSVKEANPSRANNGFDSFVDAVCTQMGAALEIPKDVLLKTFNRSYSASRAAMLEAWKMYKMRRNWLANDFCQPIYAEFLFEAIAKGRITAPGFLTDMAIRKAYCGAEWSGPAQGQIDPLKEVVAAEKRVNNGFSTRTQETLELTGGDFKTNVAAAKMENQLMIEAGLKEGDSAK